MDAPDYTYTGIGLTRVGEMPSGYRQMHHRIAVGEGHEAFLRLAEGILTWELHRGAGLSVRADWPRAVVGSAVVSGFGVGRLRLPVPCRVVWVEEINDGDGSHRAGFGYGTLPGHPESGEEAFTAVLSADGTVYFEVFAFSRPGNWFYRLGDPVARACQWLVTRGYLAAARRLASGTGPRTRNPLSRLIFRRHWPVSGAVAER